MRFLILALVLAVASCATPQPSVCNNFIGFERSICSINETYLATLRTANTSLQAGDIDTETHKKIIEVLVDVDSMLDNAEIILGSGGDPTQYMLIAQDLLRSL